MKFVILLLAFFIPLLTSTSGELMCYNCSTETQPECVTLNEQMKGDMCTDPRHKCCITWFSDDGKLTERSCTYEDPTPSSFGLNYVEKTGCQSLKNKDGKIKVRMYLCDTDNCNIDTKEPSDSESGNGNKSKNNSCKIVGMSLTTLLGKVLRMGTINRRFYEMC